MSPAGQGGLRNGVLFSAPVFGALSRAVRGRAAVLGASFRCVPCKLILSLSLRQTRAEISGCRQRCNMNLCPEVTQATALTLRRVVLLPILIAQRLKATPINLPTQETS